MFEVLISNEAEKYYKRQDTDTKKRINKCIDVLSSNPKNGPRIKRLYGRLEGKYRYQIGGIRIVYTVDTNGKTVKINAIRGRGDVYKK